MTFQEALKQGEAYLQKKEISDASIDAWYLLEYLLRERGKSGINRAWFLLHRQEHMETEDYEAYEALLAKRGTHMPLQHITGEQEFMGLTFHVNDKVLIPRQDTEILVEEGAKFLKKGQKLLDICTGSGCIAISLGKVVPGIFVTACDLSEDALKVAAENAHFHQVEVDFRQGDLLEPVEGRFDVIISNPPYIPTGEIDGLMEEVRLFDPRMALDGREDGLYFYRKIAEESPAYLREGGALLFEIGCEQGEAVAELMRAAGFCEVMVCKDLAGLDRVVKGRMPESRRKNV